MSIDTRRLLRALTLAIALVTLAGCWGMGGMQTNPYAAQDPTEAPDMAIAEQVADAKKAADAAPGDAQAAINYAELLGAAYAGGTVSRGRLAGDAMRTDALAKLDAAAASSASDPQQAAELVAVKGRLYASSGMPDAAVTEFEASMATWPNLVALQPLIETYAAQRRHDEIDAHCQATREITTDNDTRFAVLAWCATARPGMSGAQALPWASAEDVAFYDEQVAIETARAQAEYEAEMTRQAEAERQVAMEEEARRQAEARSPANTAEGSSSSGGSGFYSASVSVDSDCRETVHIFEGRVSGSYTGSGTYGRHSANSVTSYHLSGDDQLCLITESRDILSCVKPEDGARLRIPESCSGLMPR